MPDPTGSELDPTLNPAPERTSEDDKPLNPAVIQNCALLTELLQKPEVAAMSDRLASFSELKHKGLALTTPEEIQTTKTIADLIMAISTIKVSDDERYQQIERDAQIYHDQYNDRLNQRSALVDRRDRLFEGSGTTKELLETSRQPTIKPQIDYIEYTTRGKALVEGLKQAGKEKGAALVVLNQLTNYALVFPNQILKEAGSDFSNPHSYLFGQPLEGLNLSLKAAIEEILDQNPKDRQLDRDAAYLALILDYPHFINSVRYDRPKGYNYFDNNLTTMAYRMDPAKAEALYATRLQRDGYNQAESSWQNLRPKIELEYFFWHLRYPSSESEFLTTPAEAMASKAPDLIEFDKFLQAISVKEQFYGYLYMVEIRKSLEKARSTADLDNARDRIAASITRTMLAEDTFGIFDASAYLAVRQVGKFLDFLDSIIEKVERSIYAQGFVRDNNDFQDSIPLILRYEETDSMHINHIKEDVKIETKPTIINQTELTGLIDSFPPDSPICIFTGSYNPFARHHLEIFRNILANNPKTRILVMVKEDISKKYSDARKILTYQQRLEITRRSLQGLDAVTLIDGAGVFGREIDPTIAEFCNEDQATNELTQQVWALLSNFKGTNIPDDRLEYSFGSDHALDQLKSRKEELYPRKKKIIIRDTLTQAELQEILLHNQGSELQILPASNPQSRAASEVMNDVSPLFASLNVHPAATGDKALMKETGLKLFDLNPLDWVEPEERNSYAWDLPPEDRLAFLKRMRIDHLHSFRQKYADHNFLYYLLTMRFQPDFPELITYLQNIGLSDIVFEAPAKISLSRYSLEITPTGEYRGSLRNIET